MKKPPRVVQAPSGVFVRLPVAPETIAAVSELVETLTAAETSLRSLLGACVSAAAQADRELARARSVLPRRRKRRRA